MKTSRLAVAAVFLLQSFPLLSPLQAQQTTFRVVAANLTSGNAQAYSADNSNHSNLEGAGARILKGLKPDIVLIQEFNVAGGGSTSAVRQWVNSTLGSEYEFAREEGAGIPNGVISRFPIVAQGEWDDPTQTNRDFSWAKIRLPNKKNLWAISVHLYSQQPSVRAQEAAQLLTNIKKTIPAGDLVVLGGDFNTRKRAEACVMQLSTYFHAEGPYPIDENGDGDTNSSRGKPYDWVLADHELHAKSTTVKIGSGSFPQGFVLDTRVFSELDQIWPAQEKDSGTPNMQHMAVVRDFSLN